MSYDPYYDPTGRTKFTKDLWDTTNKWNDEHAKNMNAARAEEQRYRADVTPSGGNSGSGSAALFWLAAGLLFGGYLVLQLL